MAGTIVADTIQADSTSTLVLKNGVANTPPTIQDSAGTQIGTFCRAWVNFNGTGTVAIRASFNVTSITDNGTGQYTVNLTTAMPDTNYAVFLAVNSDATNSMTIYENTGSGRSGITTSSFPIATTISNTGATVDRSSVNASVFR